MAKTRVRYVCQTCGHDAPKWLGRCPACQEWNTLVEELVTQESERSGAALRPGLGGQPLPVPLPDVSSGAEARIATGLMEMDRVLGGGIVPGSLILTGGDPGIGKSTLLLQLCERLATQGLKSLYVSGEESAAQIRMRADRLGVSSASILLLTETDLERIQHFVRAMRPDILVIDSIQTMHDSRIGSTPGSVGQVRECTAQLAAVCKGIGLACFIIGHVTKAGTIAGPRVLEHMVDTVLYFEGDRHHQYRVIRAVKNRFGSTNEIGVFEIRESGLVEVANPSAMWIGQHAQGVPGSAVTCAMEGSRPFLVEVQALVSAVGLSVPRRVTTGIDHNRASIIVAVLEKRAGLPIGGHDIYVSVAGGFSLDEPACDLAVALALASSFRDKPAPRDAVAIGEIGLAGEVRGVDRLAQRVREAVKLGFRTCFVPRCSMAALEPTEEAKLIGVATVREALDVVLGGMRVD